MHQFQVYQQLSRFVKTLSTVAGVDTFWRAVQVNEYTGHGQQSPTSFPFCIWYEKWVAEPSVLPQRSTPNTMQVHVSAGILIKSKLDLCRCISGGRALPTADSLCTSRLGYWLCHCGNHSLKRFARVRQETELKKDVVFLKLGLGPHCPAVLRWFSNTQILFMEFCPVQQYFS